MKVKELIDALCKANPEAEVVTVAWNGFTETYAALDFVYADWKFRHIYGDFYGTEGEIDMRIFGMEDDDDIVMVGSSFVDTCKRGMYEGRNIRMEIQDRIIGIEAGVVFDAIDIMSPDFRRDEVTRVIAALKKRGAVRSIARGVYFKPETLTSMILGLGEVPVSHQALIDYYSRKYDCHPSGPYGYNRIGLTEQCANTITLAGRRKFSPFRVENCAFEYCYSPIGRQDDDDALRLTILLDALSDPAGVPGRIESDLINSSKQIIAGLCHEEQELLRSLASVYPESVISVCDDAMDASGTGQEILHGPTDITRRKGLDFTPLKTDLQLSPEMRHMIDDPIHPTDEQLQDSRIIALLDEPVL